MNLGKLRKLTANMTDDAPFQARVTNDPEDVNIITTVNVQPDKNTVYLDMEVLTDNELHDQDEKNNGLVLVAVDVTGPKGTSQDDLVNNAREAICRAGYQVGDFDNIENYEPDRDGEAHLLGNLDVDERLADHVKIGSDGFTEEWNGVTIHAEAP